MKQLPRMLPAAVRTAILVHAQREAPRECCGFLVGARGRVRFALAMENVDPRPASRYRIDNRQHIEARRWLRQLRPRLEIVGVYHSHPSGNVRPSPADRQEALYSEWLYAIVCPGTRDEVGVFRIAAGRARRVGR
jgi:proteasome lid subunit RPN8/RPN11